MPDNDADWLRFAHHALANFPIQPNHIKLISHAENVSFFVESEQSERFVLRIHRPGYHSLEELESEQIWTEALVACGFDAPIPVRTKDGSRYTQIKLTDHTRNVGLLQWVDGQTLRETAHARKDSVDREQTYRAMGRLLAQLHEQAGAWLPPSGFSRHSFDENGLMGEQPFWGRFWEANGFSPAEQASLLEMRQSIYELLSKLPKDKHVYSMIHADLHTGNLIEHGDQLHIIDFDDAGFGWHSYDFAVALGEIRQTPDWERLSNEFFTAYATVRRLEDWVRELVPLFFVIRNLVSIGWIDARPELARDASYARFNYDNAQKGFQAAYDQALTTIRQMGLFVDNIQSN